jgi:tetratricopeptide (TPR) repeat protein
MIESATLSPAERTRRQIERLRQEAAAHPDDPDLQLHFAGLLLSDGKLEEASAAFRVLLSRNADSRVSEEAGRFLISFEQYALAREFLERAPPGLDLAIALLFTDGPEKALKALEKNEQESGDYLLLKASLLDAAGQDTEAEKVLERGLRLPISRPQIAQQAALLLLRRNRKDLALDLLNKAGGGNPELKLTQAVVLGLMDRNPAADKALKEIESQWPEWDRPYLAHGLLLERAQPREAGRKLRTAIALGSTDPAVRCALARLESTPPPDPRCACAGGLYDLLFPSCAKP